MRTFLILASLLALAAPAAAANYPVAGKWGQSSSTEKGPVDCKSLRVIEFKGNQRTDSAGGVPAYKNVSVQPSGPATFRIVDEFVTGQIAGRTNLTLRQVDDDRIELNLQPGGMLKLKRCK